MSSSPSVPLREAPTELADCALLGRLPPAEPGMLRLPLPARGTPYSSTSSLAGALLPVAAAVPPKPSGAAACLCRLGDCCLRHGLP